MRIGKGRLQRGSLPEDCLDGYITISETQCIRWEAREGAQERQSWHGKAMGYNEIDVDNMEVAVLENWLRRRRQNKFQGGKLCMLTVE